MRVLLSNSAMGIGEASPTERLRPNLSIDCIRLFSDDGIIDHPYPTAFRLANCLLLPDKNRLDTFSRGRLGLYYEQQILSRTRSTEEKALVGIAAMQGKEPSLLLRF